MSKNGTINPSESNCKHSQMENSQSFKAASTEMWAEWPAAAYVVPVSIETPGGITKLTTKWARLEIYDSQ